MQTNIHLSEYVRNKIKAHTNSDKIVNFVLVIPEGPDRYKMQEYVRWLNENKVPSENVKTSMLVFEGFWKERKE